MADTQTARTIPVSSAAVTVDWLNEVLDGRVAPITRVTVEPLGDGVGLLGEVTRLRLDYRTGSSLPTPSTMIAKCQSVSAENVFISQVMGFYERESSFYANLAEHVAVHVPHCWYTAVAPEGAPYVVLLEEITGGRAIDQIVGANEEDCAAVIDQAVALHSRFWDNADLFSLEWLPPMNNPLYKGAQQLAEPKMAGFVDRWRARVPADALAWVEAVTPRYPDLLDWWVEQGNPTYAHTDFRADNFIFGGSAGDGVVTVLDWQLGTRHVGVWDVANFLGASVTIEQRRATEDGLVRRYHDGLLAAGVAGYPWERCWRDYRYCLLQQAWAQVPISDLDPGNERGRALLDAMITRHFTAASDHGAGEMLELL